MGIFDRQPKIDTDAALARDKERAREREVARIEEERKKALAGSEDTGLMHGDPSIAIEKRKERVERDQNAIQSILGKIRGGFK